MSNAKKQPFESDFNQIDNLFDIEVYFHTIFNAAHKFYSSTVNSSLTCTLADSSSANYSLFLDEWTSGSFFFLHPAERYLKNKIFC